MNSAVAVGNVVHRRTWPVPHVFTYRTGWVLIDTREAQQVLNRGWWCGFRRPGLVRFHRQDFLAGDDDLDTAVRDRVQAERGERPTGAIQVLTNLRMAGHCFNPVSFYFCRDAAGAVRHIIAEITNTPWRERFAYVLGGAADPADQHFDFAKRFHVSPFHPMDQRYSWRFRFIDQSGTDELGVASPANSVMIHMVNHQVVDGRERPIFEAALAVSLAPATPARLLHHVISWPFMTVRILWGIYFQALRLKLKRVPFFDHSPVIARSLS